MKQHKTIEIDPRYTTIDALIVGLPEKSDLEYHAIKFAMDKTAAKIKFDKQRVATNYYATITVPLRARVNLPVIEYDFTNRLKGIKEIMKNLEATNKFFKSLHSLAAGSAAEGILEAGAQLPTVRLNHITFKTPKGSLFKFKHRSEAGKRSALILEEVTSTNGIKRNITELLDNELEACVKILSSIYHAECEWTIGRNGFSCGAGAKVTEKLNNIDA